MCIRLLRLGSLGRVDAPQPSRHPRAADCLGSTTSVPTILYVCIPHRQLALLIGLVLVTALVPVGSLLARLQVPFAWTANCSYSSLQTPDFACRYVCTSMASALQNQPFGQTCA